MSDQAEHAAASDGAHDTTTNRKKTGMLDLPAELLVRVANNLKKKDILNFRKLCRELAAAAEDQFISEYFTERHHLLEVHSLEVLKNISADRHLTRRLRKLVLVPVSLGTGILCTDCAATEDFLCKMDCNTKTVIFETEIHKERAAFEAEGMGIALLQTCLLNVKAAGIVPELSLNGVLQSRGSTVEASNAREGIPTVYGHARLDARLGVVSSFDWTKPEYSTSFDESLLLFLNAIGSTHFPVEKLSVHYAPGKDRGIETDQTTMPSHLQSSLVGMRHFEISGSFFMHPNTRHFLKQVLAIPPSLSSLSLHLRESGGKTEVQWACSATTKNQLKEIKISGGEIDNNFCSLWPLLEKHQGSLRRLELNLSDLWQASKDFNWFAMNLNLDSFEFTDVRVAMEDFSDTLSVADGDYMSAMLLEWSDFFLEVETEFHLESGLGSGGESDDEEEM